MNRLQRFAEWYVKYVMVPMAVTVVGIIWLVTETVCLPWTLYKTFMGWIGYYR